MTSNGYFAFKSVSGSAFNGLAFCLFGKTILKFADHAYTVSSKNVAQGLCLLVTGDISLILGYSLRFHEEGASSRRTVFTALTHAVH